MSLKDAEMLELLELLEESKLSDWERRERRMRAAERRLGMWEGEKFIGVGLAEIIFKARHGKPITQGEFIIANFGFLPGEFRRDGSAPGSSVC